jgi:hypothetical protein
MPARTVSRLRRHLPPETCAEGALNRFSRVAALVGNVTNGVFLLQGVPSRQSSKPFAGTGECGPTISCVVVWGYASDQFTSTPADGALRFVDERTKSRYPVRLDERVWILCVGEEFGRDYAERRRVARPADRFDGARDAFAARIVVVEGEHDSVEAEPSESRDYIRLYARAADRSNVRESF